MPINSLATADIFQRMLDKIAERDATTGWMDANAGQVIYNGGATVKIPKMTVQGLGEYDRDTGYAQGSIGLSYESRELTQDRGRKFHLDAMDVDETNFVATAGNVMSEFQRLCVIPEIDAYRISKVASYAIAADTAAAASGGTGLVEYGYTPGAQNTSALRKFKEGIKAVRESGYNGQLVCQASDEFLMELELELAGKLHDTTWSQGGINTKVPAVDLVPVIATPANRMYTAITLYDGVTTAGTNQTPGGYVKGASAKDINFIILPQTTPIAVQKQDKMRIFSPDINQTLNAWRIDYRRFHDLWVLDNKVNSIFVSIKDAASGATGATGSTS